MKRGFQEDQHHYPYQGGRQKTQRSGDKHELKYEVSISAMENGLTKLQRNNALDSLIQIRHGSLGHSASLELVRRQML